MKSEARAMYWELAIRLITRAEVAAWADKMISAGAANEELFELSTCAELDDNDVMKLLTKVSSGYDTKEVEQQLIAKLIAYYSSVGAGKVVNTNLLSDYFAIDDLSPHAHSALMHIEDEIWLSREGIKWLRAHESRLIIETMRKFLVDAPSPHL